LLGFFIPLVAAAIAWCAEAPKPAIRPSGTLSLFNGKNLDGWYT